MPLRHDYFNIMNWTYQAAFTADSQVPWNVDAPAGQITDPAWRTKPS
jgi:hypothetical protein